MSRMDAVMMAARGGKGKGERRFTITESGQKSSAPIVDPSKKDQVAGMNREEKFEKARERAQKRNSGTRRSGS